MSRPFSRRDMRAIQEATGEPADRINPYSFRAQRKAAREGRRIRAKQWSENRPTKPERDPIAEQLAEIVAGERKVRDFRWQQANRSGLSGQTIAKIEKGKTKRPQGVTLQMLADSLGYEVKLVKKGG